MKYSKEIELEKQFSEALATARTSLAEAEYRWNRRQSNMRAAAERFQQDLPEQKEVSC